MDKYTYLANATPEYLENLYRDFKSKPDSVDPEFRKFFEGFDFAQITYSGKATTASTDEWKVYALIDGYRRKGHLTAHTNPIKPRKDRHANRKLRATTARTTPSTKRSTATSAAEQSEAVHDGGGDQGVGQRWPK